MKIRPLVYSKFNLSKIKKLIYLEIRKIICNSSRKVDHVQRILKIEERKRLANSQNL